MYFVPAKKNKKGLEKKKKKLTNKKWICLVTATQLICIISLSRQAPSTNVTPSALQSPSP